MCERFNVKKSIVEREAPFNGVSVTSFREPRYAAMRPLEIREANRTLFVNVCLCGYRVRAFKCYAIVSGNPFEWIVHKNATPSRVKLQAERLTAPEWAFSLDWPWWPAKAEKRATGYEFLLVNFSIIEKPDKGGVV